MNGQFSLSQPEAVEKQLASLLETLADRGERRSARATIRWILEELARTPMEFGESREEMHQLGYT